MDAIDRARQSILKFLESREQRVLALKGPWGVGKSFFIRNFLRTNTDQLPEYTAFVSVFGLRSLKDVRTTISDCVEPTQPSQVKKFAKQINKVLSFAKPTIPDFTGPAFWHLAKQKGILIVVDDLERTHKDLGLEEILGLASSITENSRAKFLFIFNEDKLDSANQESLTRFREKVIDVELRYEPNTEELVESFLGFPQLTDTVVRCLNASEGANIRLILKIKHAVEGMVEALKAENVTLDDDDLKQVARVAWLFFVAHRPLTVEILKSLGVAILFGGERDDIDDNMRGLGRLARRAELFVSDLDPIVIEFLSAGYLPLSAAEHIGRLKSTAFRNEYNRRAKEAYRPYVSNFSAPVEAVTRPIVLLLEDYADKIDLETLQSHCAFLDELGVEAESWRVKHVRAVVDKLDAHACNEYLRALPQGEARRIVEEQKKLTEIQFDFRKVIARIGHDKSWHPDEIVALESVSDDDYQAWFRSDYPDLLSILRRFFGIFSNSPSGTAAGNLYGRFAELLRGIAVHDPVNSKRVFGFLGIAPLTSPKNTPK